jgi:predicted RNA-binding protein with EMAP domain
MKIAEVRKKYPDLKISYLPKKDYLYGIDDNNSIYRITKTVSDKLNYPRRKDKYNEVFLAKNKESKHYLLYPYQNFKTGSFNRRQEAINYFRNGGR